MQTTPTLPPMPTLPAPVQEPTVPDLEQQRREQAIRRIRAKNAFKIPWWRSWSSMSGLW